MNISIYILEKYKTLFEFKCDIGVMIKLNVFRQFEFQFQQIFLFCNDIILK